MNTLHLGMYFWTHIFSHLVWPTIHMYLVKTVTKNIFKFLNDNVFRIQQHDLSPIHLDSVIYRQVLHALYWLPVKFQICDKIAVISFKAIYNLGPVYLSDLINIRQCSRYYPRCNVGVFLPDHSATFKFKHTLGDRSFTAAAPKVWNILPDY